MTFYTPQFFHLEEFFDPIVCARFSDRAWSFMDPRLLLTMDRIRAYFGVAVTVNTWKDGGPHKDRGFRAPHSKVGAEYSQHRMGRACDFDVKGLTAEDVREEIRTHPHDAAFSMISRVELGTSWVHIDMAHIKDPIEWFHP